MTIQKFSDRTGLPASTLRFYEKEGLLAPDVRAENGYRLYDENQIPRAIKIHSLRQTGIRLTEIQEYLSAGEEEQEHWLRKWRSDIDTKLSYLRVAKQFLYGIAPKDEHIKLVKWDESVHTVWFRHRVKQQMQPFAKVIEKRAAYMKSLNLLYTQEAYVIQDDMEGKEIVGRVGFRLRGNCDVADHLRNSDAEFVTSEPTLFVTLDCLSNDPYSCFSHMLLLQSFGFEPIGPSMERYQLHEKRHYEIMIPVVYGTQA